MVGTLLFNATRNKSGRHTYTYTYTYTYIKRSLQQNPRKQLYYRQPCIKRLISIFHDAEPETGTGTMMFDSGTEL